MNPLSALALVAVLIAVLYAAWKRALLSLTLAIAIVVVYLLDYASRFTPSLGPEVFTELAWSRYPQWGFYSAPWTPLTAIFIHGSATHLIFNLLGFVLLTPLLEERIGSLRWGVIFLVGALFGQLLFFLARFNQNWTLVGASGGLFAVLGAFARLYPRERVTLFLPLPGMPAFPVIWIAVGYLHLSFLFTSIPIGGSGPLGFLGNVAWEAHIGGLAFGLAAAPLVMRLPAGRVRGRAAPVNVAALEPLAATRELQQILEELRTADVPEVRQAWIERFAAKAKCPTCGGPVRYRRGRLSSACGWRQPV